MGVVLEGRAAFDETLRFLKQAQAVTRLSKLRSLAERGREALAAATPVDSGTTASSWGVEVTEKQGLYTITWTNSNVQSGVPIAIILQYGHGTGTGGYVRGRDYINPAMAPVFEEIKNSVWRVIDG